MGWRLLVLALCWHRLGEAERSIGVGVNIAAYPWVQVGQVGGYMKWYEWLANDVENVVGWDKEFSEATMLYDRWRFCKDSRGGQCSRV